MCSVCVLCDLLFFCPLLKVIEKRLFSRVRGRDPSAALKLGPMLSMQKYQKVQLQNGCFQKQVSAVKTPCYNAQLYSRNKHVYSEVQKKSNFPVEDYIHLESLKLTSWPFLWCRCLYKIFFSCNYQVNNKACCAVNCTSRRKQKGQTPAFQMNERLVAPRAYRKVEKAQFIC